MRSVPHKIADFLAERWSVLPLHGWFVGVAAVQQLLALASRFRDWLPHWENRIFARANPGGIAGGIQTTTFAIALLNLRRILLNRRDVQMFGRRVSDELSHRTFAVVLLSILWIFGATTVLLFGKESDIEAFSKRSS